MTSNIILPLSLLARSVLVVQCSTEAAMEAVSLKKWVMGVRVKDAIPLKVLKTPNPPKMEKTLVKQI